MHSYTNQTERIDLMLTSFFNALYTLASHLNTVSNSTFFLYQPTPPDLLSKNKHNEAN